MADLALDTPVQYVKGVGPVRAGQLAELGIATVEDLLLYFPFRFDLRRQCQPIDSLRGTEETATVAGEVLAVQEQQYGRRPYFQATLADDTGSVMIRWFHGGYLRSRVRPGLHVAVSGKVDTYRGKVQFINPRFQIVWDPEGTALDRDELLPVYPARGKLTSGVIASIVRRVLPEAGQLLQPWFPQEYLTKRELLSRPQAVEAMHHPEDKRHWHQARRRVVYDECLLMQLGIAITRMRQVSRPAHSLVSTQQIDERIRARFPFRLTAAQDRAIAEITRDLAQDRPMNRLLQGDVGSGKTVVALYACLLAVARGKQAAIMAPTEILASQHHQQIQAYLNDSRVRSALLIGGQSEQRRAELLSQLATRQIDIVVGTHALISEGVRFSNLAVVVIDEQHKFGVRQRTQFRGKGFAPHYLVMTATPIPRTLAMTVFGDLDVSVIDALPPGRGKTETQLATTDDLDEVFAFVRQRAQNGQQAYVICPLVSPSAQLELTAAEEAYRDLAEGPLRGLRVALVHGQMNPARKDAVMADFRRGHTDVLVASVVVEVGVDVPTANVMVVLHAERFGLAQLHQLRGRIGRGAADATCILVASPKSISARRRLRVLAGTDDGFEVAEEDLRLRGPGEFFGTRQHGLPELKVTDLADDLELLRRARRDAFEIVAGDPGLNAPHHQQLRAQMLKAYGGRLDFLTGA